MQTTKPQWSNEGKRITLGFHHDHPLLEMSILAFLLGMVATSILPLGSIVGLRHLVTIEIILPHSLPLVLVIMMITEGALLLCLTGIAIPPRLLATTEAVIHPCQILLIVAILFLRLTMIAMIEGLATDLELIHHTVPVLRLEQEKSTKDLPGSSNI
jgi:hypothetical protein